MFRSQFAAYQKLVDLKEEDRIALLEQWKATGVEPEVKGWWIVDANASSATEIKEAIDDIPPGGVCLINLTQDINITTSAISFLSENKKIYVDGKGIYNINITWDNTGGGTLFAGTGILVFTHLAGLNVNITDGVSIGSSLIWPTNRYLGEAENILLQVVVANSNLRLTDNSGNSVGKNFSSGNLFLQGVNAVIDSSGSSTVKLLSSANSCPMLFSVQGSTLQDENGNSLSWQDYVANVVKDANGVPRNIISNLVF